MRCIETEILLSLVTAYLQDTYSPDSKSIPLYVLIYLESGLVDVVLQVELQLLALILQHLTIHNIIPYSLLLCC